MTEPYKVEILDRDAPRPEPLDPLGVKAMVRIEELRLERTKFKAATAVIAVAILAWPATCYITCVLW